MHGIQRNLFFFTFTLKKVDSELYDRMNYAMKYGNH